MIDVATASDCEDGHEIGAEFLMQRSLQMVWIICSVLPVPAADRIQEVKSNRELGSEAGVQEAALRAHDPDGGDPPELPLVPPAG